MYDSDWPRSPASAGSCWGSSPSWSSSTAGEPSQPFFVRGDLLYHWGLTHTILLGSFPPEGPYAGPAGLLPAGIPSPARRLSPRSPGFDVPSATNLLGIVWLPVIPLGAYLLARRLTGRGDVALVAAALTAFGGGLDVSNDRLWVNSMFLVGQVAYPIYPRDLVFGILPFAILAFLRATDGGRRWAGWALLAGGLLGVVRADPGPAPAADPDRPRHAGRGPRVARSRAAGRSRSARSC